MIQVRGIPLPRVLQPRLRSLIRANALVLVSLLVAFLMSDFPRDRATPWLILPTVTALLGTLDTLRCMQKRWNFYHGGVILCLYMDLMVLAVIFFFLIYPYAGLTFR